MPAAAIPPAAATAAPAATGGGAQLVAPGKSPSQACVQQGQWKETPVDDLTPHNHRGKLYRSSRRKCPVCVRSLATSGRAAPQSRAGRWRIWPNPIHRENTQPRAERFCSH